MPDFIIQAGLGLKMNLMDHMKLPGLPENPCIQQIWTQSGIMQTATWSRSPKSYSTYMRITLILQYGHLAPITCFQERDVEPIVAKVAESSANKTGED